MPRYTQICLALSPNDYSHIDSLCQCIDEINSWMCQNFLQLNKECIGRGSQWGYNHLEIRLGISGYHQHSCDRQFGSSSLSDLEAGGERPASPGQNQEFVPKRGTTSVARSRVFKHCSFKTTDFKPLKLKQQSYMRASYLSV